MSMRYWLHWDADLLYIFISCKDLNALLFRIFPDFKLCLRAQDDREGAGLETLESDVGSKACKNLGVVCRRRN